MKYPSADSLNSATNYQYVFDDFIETECRIMRVIDWQLLQYPVYDFVNLFLAHGCLFDSDLILQIDSTEVHPTRSSAANLRKYAEFFTDFCIQEPSLIKTEPLVLSSAIIAVTRKHMNLETVWTEELALLTTLKLSNFKDVFHFIDQRYAKNFPDSVASQINHVRGRQKLECTLPIPTEKLKSAEMSSAKASGSATTQPYTNHANSGASQTSKYGTLSSQKAFYDCFKSSSVKK